MILHFRKNVTCPTSTSNLEGTERKEGVTWYARLTPAVPVCHPTKVAQHKTEEEVM